MVSLRGACRAQPTLRCPTRFIHITSSCTRKGSEKISRGVRKTTCKMVGSPDAATAAARMIAVCQFEPLTLGAAARAKRRKADIP